MEAPDKRERKTRFEPATLYLATAARVALHPSRLGASFSSAAETKSVRARGSVRPALSFRFIPSLRAVALPRAVSPRIGTSSRRA